MTSVNVMMACAWQRLAFDSSIEAIIYSRRWFKCSSVHMLSADTRPSDGEHTFMCRTSWDSVCQEEGCNRGCTSTPPTRRAGWC